MEFTINNILYKGELLSKILYANEDKSISKDLKIKIITFKIIFNDYIRDYQKYINEINEELLTPRYTELLNNKAKLTMDEQLELDKLETSMLEERNELAEKKINSIVDIKEITKDNFFTKDEYKELLEINVDHTILIGNTTVDGANYCEELYKEFVYIE